MKKITSLVLALCIYSQLVHALPPDDRQMTIGTVFNYAVKEGSLSYIVKLTVTEWDKVGNIQLQWQASGGKNFKGLTVQPYLSLELATEMKIQLKAGKETLTNDACRWFTGYETYDFLYNLGMEAALKIDDKTLIFIANEDDTEKDILYNNVNTTMNYAEGTKSSATATITIGFIEYADRIIVLDNYVNEQFSIKLVSIQSPGQKATAKTNKTTTEMADEIIKSMAPKNPVPLKKMEAAKFANIKSRYPLLATIENYDATNDGKIAKPITETYEFRYEHKSPNPPSLIDCFTADLQILYKQKDNYGIVAAESIGSKSLPSATAKKILEVYLNKEYRNIPGYRPWTHWRFVKSLTESQRNQLAIELQGYIAQYGFSE